MGKLEKTLKKIRDNPDGWRIEQLEAIAKRHGIGIRKTGGSHVVFHHANCEKLVCVPAHRPIKPIYAKQFLVLLNSAIGGDKK